MDDWGLQAVFDVLLSLGFAVVVLLVAAFVLRADARRGLRKSDDQLRRPEALVLADRQSLRVRRALFWIRLELAVAFGVALLTGFLWIATPGCMCGMFSKPPSVERLMPWAALGGLVVGLAGVIWFSRIDPERGDRTWRYHDW